MLAAAGCPPQGAESPDRDLLVIAAAANLAPVLDTLVAAFTAGTGYEVTVSMGSTGQLYAQIRNGAPFHVFLAADTLRPRLLADSGLAAPGSAFAYAVGRLVVYAPGRASSSADPWAVLRGAERVAIANPRTAPYGEAAVAALERLGLAPALVRGESVGQAFQFVESGAVDVGLVSLAQVRDRPPGTWSLVPDSLHAPLRQDAVLLERAAGHPAATAFVAFLSGPESDAIFARYGYGSTAPGGRR